MHNAQLTMHMTEGDIFDTVRKQKKIEKLKKYDNK